MAHDARLFMLLQGPTGTIQGECQTESRLHWIDVAGWDWALDARTLHADGQSVQPSVLTLSKSVDRASTAMLNAMGKADVLSASVQMQGASQDGFHLVVALQKVRITHYELQAECHQRSVRIMERWTLDYDSVLFSYQPDDKSGVMQVGLTRPPGSSGQDREKQLAPQELS